MTLDQFRASSAVQDNLPKCADAIDRMLCQHLLDTCINAPTTPEMAPVVLGAEKAIANLILIFRQAVKPADKKTIPKLTPLLRFSADKQTTAANL